MNFDRFNFILKLINKSCSIKLKKKQQNFKPSATPAFNF